MNADPPPALALAHELAPGLAGLGWAIGGSTLLHHLGLEPAPRDLDIVVTLADFDALDERLTERMGAGFRPAHESHRSARFKRFESAAGTVVEVMAGIASTSGGRTVHWHFDPQRVELADGLPWMRAQDWVDLYTLFGRPARVAQLAAYLAARERHGGGQRTPIR